MTDPQISKEDKPEGKLSYPKPQLYAYYFQALKEIAKEYGYNLVIHGSMNRDCDLIAIRWTDDAKDEFELINALAKHLTGHVTDIQYRELIYLYKELPAGRHSYIINLNRGGYHRNDEDENGMPKYDPDPQYYIDISVTPLRADREAQLLRKEIEDLKAQDREFEIAKKMYDEDISKLEAQVKAKDEELGITKERVIWYSRQGEVKDTEITELRGKVERLTEILKEAQKLISEKYSLHPTLTKIEEVLKDNQTPGK